MLRQLLDSFCTLRFPEGFQVEFLIVDNDPDGSARSTVAEFQDRLSGNLIYVAEPEPGIPAARNRALDEAVQRGGRFLCFLDDDEYPDPSWLVELVGHRHATNAVLIGGPVRLLPPESVARPWQRFLAQTLLSHSRRMERYYADNARHGRIIKVATNNWLGDLTWIENLGLRFDLAAKETGGSDGTFFNAVRNAGGPVSWCETAIVYDHLPRERLSLRYQFSRFRTYGHTKARLRTSSTPLQVARMAIGVGLLLVPVYGWASFMMGVQLIGVGVGWFSHKMGRTSTFYAREPAA